MYRGANSYLKAYLDISFHLTFWQVSVQKNAIWYFMCRRGCTKKMVEKHFGDISGALLVFDDIIIGGKSEEEHDLILRKVLRRARERNIKFNRDRIQFRVN